MVLFKGNRYRLMLNSLKNGLYSVDENRKIRFWSKGLETLTGNPSDSVMGATFNDGLLKYEDEAGNPVPSYELPLTLCLQKKATVTGYFFLTTESDERIPLEETAIPLFERERFAGVVVSVRDISGCIKTARSWMKSGRNEKMIPICGWCKKIRSDTEKWEKLETYLAEEGFGIFTHGMCPSCAEKIFEKGVYLESYQKICKEISASITLDEVLHLIVTNVVKVMNVKASLLRLLNKETRQLELAAYYGLSEKYADKGPVSYDASIDDALAGKPVSVYDITEHKDSQYYRDAVEEGIRSILSIPLRLEKEVIGVLRMYTGEPVKYTDEDLQFMSAIAEQAAVAIFNARRFETAVSNEKEYLRVFEEITKAVSSTLDVNEVLDMIVKKIPEVMNLKAATVRLLDHTGKSLKLVASYGLSEEYLNKGPVDAERNIIEALKENAVAIYDVSTDSRIQYQKEAAEEGIKSMLTLPVVARGKILGILRLLTDKPRKFQQQEIDFVSSLAEQCGMAIENATMYERLKKDYDGIMKYVDGAVFERE